MSQPQQPRTEDLAGRVVANVRVEEKLGAGGMGAVFAGTHLGLGQRVAIKLLPAVPPPPQQFVKRFFREAQALAKLEHPNIVHVFDVGQQDPYYYIVMQLIQARSLEWVVKEQGRLKISKALRIIRDVADAVAHAHGKGILHRDLKPDNLLWVEDSSEVKVIDFGLAKVEGTAEAQALTMTGQIMGTPMYMAPEQAEGKPADFRTDIYSLGAVGFFILTGEFPFLGRSGMDILLKKIRESPRKLQDVRPEVPKPVCDLIDRMMARDPARRFQSMTRVRDILDQALGPRDGAGPSSMNISSGGSSGQQPKAAASAHRPAKSGARRAAAKPRGPGGGQVNAPRRAAAAGGRSGGHPAAHGARSAPGARGQQPRPAARAGRPGGGGSRNAAPAGARQRPGRPAPGRGGQAVDVGFDAPHLAAPASASDRVRVLPGSDQDGGMSTRARVLLVVLAVLLVAAMAIALAYLLMRNKAPGPTGPTDAVQAPAESERDIALEPHIGPGRCPTRTQECPRHLVGTV